jgi:acetyl coenzyme A synthetase (ADP forming)-like protein
MNVDRIRAYREPAVLRDGTSLLIRSIQPSDKARLLAHFRSLSPESVRHRMFAAKKTLEPAELRYFTEVDCSRHVALAAVVREDASDEFVGIGRYIVNGSASAEVAFAVVDQYQGRGIGTLLLEHLAAIARSAGIEHLDAHVLADNQQMMRVFIDSGFVVERALDAGVYRVSIPTRDTNAFRAASIARELGAVAQSIKPLFEPRSVALIGASRREGSIGRAIMSKLVASGFAGAIYPVNPYATELDGRRAYASVSAIGAGVDLAVIAIPAPLVPAAIADCARARVRAAVVISSGFAERGAAGKVVQDELRAAARAAGMRLVGPNCMGVLNASPSVRLNATFAPTWPPSGNVSMSSQSGALGIAMLDHAKRIDLGIAKFVSVGNKADVSGNDLLCYWAQDPATQVIALYLESFGNPRRFARIAPEVARRKPIVAVKSGRSTAGVRAAASHSAALVNLDIGVDALFEQAGVIRTNTLEELFDVTTLLSTQPLPRGSRIGVVTNAGGLGILLADACEAHGLSLPTLDQSTLDELASFLPRDAGLANPIDMIASATPEHYERTIAAVGNDPKVDVLVAIYIPPVVTKPAAIAAAMARGAARVPGEKPIAAVFMSADGVPSSLHEGARGKVPTYAFPENAAIAIAAANRYARWRERPRGSIRSLPLDRDRELRSLFEQVASEGGSGWLAPNDVEKILALADIPLAPFRIVSPDPDDAARAAHEIGFPLVAKAIAPGLVHKTDVGGVVLGLRSPDDVRGAVRALAEHMSAAKLDLTGVLLQRQVEGGVEALVGVTTDPAFGPLLVAGLGGIEVELVRDVSVRLAPVSDVDSNAMLDGLKTAKLLDGYRGAPAADRDALRTIIEKVSALVEAVPALEELELNPVRVLPLGRGAIAVDARIRLRTAER